MSDDKKYLASDLKEEQQIEQVEEIGRTRTDGSGSGLDETIVSDTQDENIISPEAFEAQGIDNPLQVCIPWARYGFHPRYGSSDRLHLQHLTPNELIEQVNEFVDTHDLSEHRDLFQRGALVARNPNARETLDALSTEEKDALIHESNHKWSGSWALYFTVFICATGAATQGWDQTGSNVSFWLPGLGRALSNLILPD